MIKFNHESSRMNRTDVIDLSLSRIFLVRQRISTW
jgi:hypothetical protein